MSKNIKLGNNTLNGVSTIKVKDADNTSIYDSFVYPEGKKNLTNTTETDVSNYATAQIVEANLIASNIKKDVSILGVTGSMQGAKEEQNKTVTFNSDGQEVTPDTNKVLNKVTINKPSTLIPGNIRKDVVVAGVTGTYEGSGGTSLFEEYDLGGGSSNPAQLVVILTQESDVMGASVSVTINGTTYSQDGYGVRYLHFTNGLPSTIVSWDGNGDSINWAWCKVNLYREQQSNSGTGSGNTTFGTSIHPNWFSYACLIVTSPET